MLLLFYLFMFVFIGFLAMKIKNDGEHMEDFFIIVILSSTYTFNLVCSL